MLKQLFPHSNFSKKIISLFFFTGFILFSKAQQQRKVCFEVVKTGSKYAGSFIKKSFEAADMCGQMLYTLPNDIKLDDGAVIRFYSRKKLDNQSGWAADCFVPDDTKFPEVIWTILPDGYITKGYVGQRNKF